MKVGDLVCVRTLPSYIGIVLAVTADCYSKDVILVDFVETGEKTRLFKKNLRVINESR